MAEEACRKYLAAGWRESGNRREHQLARPAYDRCIRASHVFNLLDARGVISVTERQSYIMRVRELAKACGEAWVHTEAGGGAGGAASGGRFPTAISLARLPPAQPGSRSGRATPARVRSVLAKNSGNARPPS